MYRYYNKQLFNKIVKNIKNVKYTTQPAVKTKDEYDRKIKEFEDLSRVTPKVRTKKPQKPPFVKNLMVGVFDPDVLTYPELKKDELSDLNNNLGPIKNFVKMEEIKNFGEFSKEFRKKMSELKLIGLQVNQLSGGRELTVTESFRFFEELAKIKLGSKIINNETLMVQALNKFGNNKQKTKYLNKLMNGELSSAFCTLEPIQKHELNKTATLGDDFKSWVLNGEKKMIINGSSADIYLVIAQTDIEQNENGGSKAKLTAFIVERDASGILTKKQKTTLGDHIEVSNVTFENVLVSPDNILGELNGGEKILLSIYPEYRLGTGPICVNILKELINKTTEDFLKTSNDTFPLYEADIVKTRMAEFVTSLYAVESVIYLTTGLIDTYEDQDVEMESTIAKIFSSEQAVYNSGLCIDLIGAESIEKNHWASELHNEALAYTVLNDNNDNLKIILALFGLQYAGVKINETVKKLRNPLFHASFILKRMWTHQRHIDDNPKLNLNLHFYVHPSLVNVAKQLEYCVLRLQFATEILLSRHGQEIVNQHNDLRRLAECIMDIYAMTASVGRASRSYCIGLQHAESEIVLASCFCASATQRVKQKVQHIFQGNFITNDENYRKISNTLFRFKEYYPVHPLSRNF